MLNVANPREGASALRSDELKALGTLAGRAIAGPAGLARGVHEAVSTRTFRALGLLGAPVRWMHEGISRTVYGAVDAGLRAPLSAGASLLVRAQLPGGSPLADSPAGGVALAALNGAIGDALARDHADLALALTLRRHGKPVSLETDSLASTYPDATGRLVVFIHGLCETEHAWRHLALASATSGGSFGARLRADLGYTPLYVRYNSGLHVSDNGRRLADLIERIVCNWPIEVAEIALIGHSMGGLVSRSACHYAEADGFSFVGRVRHIVCLGTPHLGAPLEKAANVGGWALGRLPETRPLAALVNGRSAGIKDLRFGSCIEEDWCDCEPDEFLRDRCREVPFLASARYYFIGATLTRDHRSAVGRIAGDLLVQYPSASGNGRRRRIPFEVDNGRHLGGLNHFQLLGHPAVYDQIRTWLAPRSAAAAALPAS